MAGRGYATPEDLLPVPGVKVLARDFTWREAIEPITKDRPFVGTFGPDGVKRVSPDPWDTVLPGDEDKVVGVGPGRTFAKLLHEAHPDWEIGVIPMAIGGTPVASWLPGGTDPSDQSYCPYDKAVEYARYAVNAGGRIETVLWHQGETDAGGNTLDYGMRLREVINNFRRDLSLEENVPFIMGTLADFYGGKYPKIMDGVEAVDAAMMRVVHELPYVGLVNAKGLGHRGDCLHFSATAQYVLGKRYFRMWRAMTAVSPEKAEKQAIKYATAERFRSPVLLDPGEFLVTSPFGNRTHPVTGEADTFHGGIDGALWNGHVLIETYICACGDGRVVAAEDGDGAAGTYVAVDHGQGLVSKYMHLERGSLEVAAGDDIRAGVVLGYMGKTGRATGEHLHFQVEKDGVPVDPLPWLRQSSL